MNDSTAIFTEVQSQPESVTKPQIVPAPPKKTFHWVVILLIIPWIFAALLLAAGRFFIR